MLHFFKCVATQRVECDGSHGYRRWDLRDIDGQSQYGLVRKEGWESRSKPVGAIQRDAFQVAVIITIRWESQESCNRHIKFTTLAWWSLTCQVESYELAKGMQIDLIVDSLRQRSDELRRQQEQIEHGWPVELFDKQEIEAHLHPKEEATYWKR